MATILKARIVKIGNSRGIRIPKVLLEQVGLDNEVELEVQDDQIIIHPAHLLSAAQDEQSRRVAEQRSSYSPGSLPGTTLAGSPAPEAGQYQQTAIGSELGQALGLPPDQRVQVIRYENRIELIPLRPVQAVRGFLKGIDTTVEREADRL